MHRRDRPHVRGDAPNPTEQTWIRKNIKLAVGYEATNAATVYVRYASNERPVQHKHKRYSLINI
jgi:hypothetical protein